MDSERLTLSRENPRVAFSPHTAGKAMPGAELTQKPQPPTPIVDRFRALLKQREEDLRVSPDDEVSPPSTEEIVHLYEIVLSELIFNSKPIITDLTIIAGEQKDHGKGIANAICARILEVPVEHKLPSLYLLDSIVKNIGREYAKFLSSRLPEVFCEAYRQVHPNQHPAMRHLFGTWSAVFPPSVLRRIEEQLQFSPQANQQSSGLPPLRTSESPRPAHGIHVNPKYLRQLDSSDVDGVVSQRFNSTGSVSHSPFALGSNQLHPSSTARLARSSSPSNIGLDRSLPSAVDEYAAEQSPRRFVERASPSNSVFDYRLGGAMGKDEESNEWRRKRYLDGSQKRFDTSAAYNGVDHPNPRALIDAYGKDSADRSLNDKPLLVGRLGLNSLDHKATPMSWQNTEEEEFDWEDMTPNLADHGQGNDFMASTVPPSRSYKASHGTQNASSLEPDVRSTWSSQAHPPSAEQSSIVAEDSVPPLRFGHGSSGAVSRFQSEKNHNLGSRYPQEAWNMPFHHLQPLLNPLNAKGRGGNIQTPFVTSGISSGGEKMSAFNDKLLDVDIRLHGPITSRMGSSSVHSVTADSRSVMPVSMGLRPPVNVHNSHPPQVHSVFAMQNQRNLYGSINYSNTVKNQGPYNPLCMPEQQLDGYENKESRSTKSTQVPQYRPLQPQYRPPQEARENIFSSAETQVPSYLGVPPLNHGYTLRGPVPRQHLGIPTPYNPNGSSQFSLPPLPPGPPPSQGILSVQNPGSVVSSNQPGNAYSGLISSLMAQGLISLTNQSPVQDSVGVEFNADLLKVRHESVISALYGDLPRQCTTCGLRFKCQEEHSSHMDWHVTKNRMSKNRKQKPSRKWFVNTSMWLTGAEALGTEAVPGFLPAETIVEKKSDEEMAVPADEDQNSCALCGETFDDFYSDENEEWMYKDAVYMNAPDGATGGMDRSQLGPIVHAKCRSESSVVSPEGFGQDQGGIIEEGSQRKRLRS
ncbi:polyadenylation and cleavage factor homolog 4 isoform X1 [Pyrus x bretschneideri]|uniref:polyadenylation and cleavage factor homolog 4 isoform X1 n=1 Tax=Pyrus x bretschneideri TaxID=225117 RepID=UPI0020304A30|nr:polyadenylation and cleavage factor homolog 4 isoform X1 [Pyrus x bretschneideri]